MEGKLIFRVVSRGFFKSVDKRIERRTSLTVTGKAKKQQAH